jgi:hypothetical protein
MGTPVTRHRKEGKNTSLLFVFPRIISLSKSPGLSRGSVLLQIDISRMLGSFGA